LPVYLNSWNCVEFTIIHIQEIKKFTNLMYFLFGRKYNIYIMADQFSLTCDFMAIINQPFDLGK